MYVLDLLKQGGAVMYWIFAVSVIITAIVLWKIKDLFFTLRINADDFVGLVIKTVETGNIGQSVEICNRKRRHPLSRVLKAGLLKANRSDKEIQGAMEEEAMRVVPQVTRGTNYLPMLANVATLLGLLGTIFGLIIAFRSVGQEVDQSVKAEMLAKGISVAMFTTAYGLMVAIPTMILYQIVFNRQSKLIEKIEQSAAGLYNHLVALNKAGGAGRRVA
jgi:biopolymer transport protein ExbB